jgi:hypothetical protein
MEFKKTTIKSFNFFCDTTLHENMTFSEAIDNIEANENNYFYVSMNENDVVEAIENEREIADQLELELMYIDELGIFIALQP